MDHDTTWVRITHAYLSLGEPVIIHANDEAAWAGPAFNQCPSRWPWEPTDEHVHLAAQRYLKIHDI